MPLAMSTAFGAVSPDVYSPEVLADSPFGYWRLDEASGLSLADSSGNANTASILGGAPVGNGVVYQQSPLIQTGFSMTKGEAGAYFSCPNPSIGGATDWTVECWYNPDTGGGSLVDCLFYQDDVPFTTVNAFVCVYDENFGGGIQRVRMLMNGNNVVATSNNSVPLSTTTHIVVTYVNSTTTTTIYLNGSSAGSSNSETCPNLTGNFIWGLRNESDLNLTGRLDELAIYNTALSPTRVLAHYNAGI